IARKGVQAGELSPCAVGYSGRTAGSNTVKIGTAGQVAKACNFQLCGWSSDGKADPGCDLISRAFCHRAENIDARPVESGGAPGDDKTVCAPVGHVSAIHYSAASEDAPSLGGAIFEIAVDDCGLSKCGKQSTDAKQAENQKWFAD